MRRFNLIILSLLLVILAFTTSTASAATASTSKINASKNNKALRLRDNYDIIISGAGMGGLSAGIQAARMGASVLIIEPSSLIGGQAIAAGVSTMDSFTDFNNSGFNSGIYLEFINKVKNYYDARGKSMGTCYWYPGSVAFEPHIGREALLNLIAEARAKGRKPLDVFLNSNIIKVNKHNNKIISVNVNFNGNFTRDVKCKVLIDAGEYGDVLALANAGYRAGNSETPFINHDALIQEITWAAVIKKYINGVPENLSLKDKAPLPGYDLAKRNYENFVTKDGFDFNFKFPVETPLNFASHNAYRGLPDSSTPYNYDASKSNWNYITKTVLNWGNDYPGTYGWNGRRGLPAAYLEDLNLRDKIERDALIKTLHFIYYIQNELGEDWSVDDSEYNFDLKDLPKAARDLPREWQEIARHMPPIPYVRESRRVLGDYVLTSEELLQNSLSYRDGHTSNEFYDAIAIGGYILDLHGANTDADMEYNFDEKAASQAYNRPRGHFQVPLRALIAKNVDNLIAAEKNLSMSRLTAGALRLQPICMMTGQAAGALAALAALNNKDNKDIKDIKAIKVQWELLNSGVILSLCKYNDVPQGHKLHNAIEIMNLYNLIAPKEYPRQALYEAYDMEDIYAQTGAGKVMKGKDTGYFGLDDLVTRSECELIINKALNALNLDVKLDKLDKPEAFITRGDFAKALCEAFNFENIKALSKFKFDKSQHRHAEYVEKLAGLGVLDVYRADRDFKFGRPVTRGEAADMLARAMAIAN
ncbi:MAG: FAD-dependent oxidoreductase [Synergistaceae bacterium]|nr:FAD-dependent oxidoreductase [Synergistaceae bacterium]